MATLRRDGEDLVVVMGPWEKLGAARGDVRVPLSAVRDVQVLDDALGSVKGMWPRNLKWVGGYWPGAFATGSFLNGSLRTKRLFAVASSKVRRGLRIELEGAKYSALVVALDDPETTRAELGI